MIREDMGNVGTRPGRVRAICLIAIAITVGIAMPTAAQNDKTPWVAPDDAKKVQNPVKVTPDGLASAAHVYMLNCAGCHGDLNRKSVPFGESFYPPVPNLILQPLDDPEWHVFYVIHNGVRYTGMPAWDKTLSEPDMWKVTSFLTRVEKLPPAVQDYWKKSVTVNPPTSGQEGHEVHK